MEVHKTARIAKGAVVYGDVSIGKKAASGIMQSSVETAERFPLGNTVIFRTIVRCIWIPAVRWKSEIM